MTYRNVLCAYSGKASSLRYAAGVARHFQGWLTGVLRHGTPRLEARYATRLPAAVIETLRDADDVLVRQAHDRFYRIAEEYGLTERAQFIHIDSAQGQSLSDYARAFDLVVCGQHVDLPNEAHLLSRPEQIALHSGRPVLIVPRATGFEGPPKHAVLAWDGKRSAARAIGDAMPMLAPGARVTVLTVGRDRRAVPDGGSVIDWLRRHSFEADPVFVEGDRRSVPQVVLETAEKRGAEMVIMGAFEHSKIGQDIWGGVTVDMLHAARLPLFMSH